MEKNVLEQLISEGKSQRQIAKELEISEKTAQHMSSKLRTDIEKKLIISE